jgi:hypothetical protein
VWREKAAFAPVRFELVINVSLAIVAEGSIIIEAVSPDET